MTLRMTLLILLQVPTLIYALWLLDGLIRAEHELDRAAWEADGRPFFWRSSECMGFRSYMARNRIAFTWLFKTPPWVARSAHCRTQLRRLRIAVLAWNLAIVALLTYLLFAIGNGR